MKKLSITFVAGDNTDYAYGAFKNVKNNICVKFQYVTN